MKFSFDQSKLAELSKNIQVQYLPSTDNLIGPQTYSKIVEASVDLVTDQYVQLTHETRKKQRENFKDPNKYIDLLNDYLVNSEGLVTQSQYALAEKLGISSKKF